MIHIDVLWYVWNAYRRYQWFINLVRALPMQGLVSGGEARGRREYS